MRTLRYARALRTLWVSYRSWQSGNLRDGILVITRNGGRFGKGRDRISTIRSSGATRTIGAVGRPVRNFRHRLLQWHLGNRAWDRLRLRLRDRVALRFRCFLRFHCLPTALFDLIYPLSLEVFSPTRIHNNLFCLADFLGATVTEFIAHLRRKFVRPVDGDITEIPIDVCGTQGLVPACIHARRYDLQLVAMEMRAKLAATASEVRVQVSAEMMDGKRPTDPITYIAISRTTDEDPVASDLVIGDVCGVAVNHRILRGRQAVSLDVVSKIPVAYEGEIRATDPEAYLHRGIPRTAAPCERFGRQGRPTDVSGAFTPCHPSRCPLTAGHPNPANTAQLRPTPVVIAGPAERLTGNPCPALIRERPAPTCVWPP